MKILKTTICIGDVEDVPIVVEYEWFPFSRGVTDGRYGPKIEPDEPAHAEINGVTLVEDGRSIELTSAQEEAIQLKIADQLESEYEAAMEAKYEAQRDRDIT